MKNKKGFTLVELLVVIAIIGILATLAIVSLNSARTRARDSRREADLRTMQTALELYYDEHSSAYPDTSDTASDTWDEFNTTMADYVQGNLPEDPSNGGTYRYSYVSSGAYYILAAATLEATTTYENDIDGNADVNEDTTNETVVRTDDTTGTATGGVFDCADPVYCVGNPATP